MAVTKTFKGSTRGRGYSAFIESGDLFICYSNPSEGGEIYRGSYENAKKPLAMLKKEAPVLYRSIASYYEDGNTTRVSEDTHSTGDERATAVGYCSEGNPRQKAIGYYCDPTKKTDEDLKKDYGFDEETKTILYKVKIYNKNGAVHICLVRGRFQADIIKKLMPQIPEVLTIQTVNADVFAIRSSEISAVEFVED